MLLLIDANMVVHRSCHVNKDLCTSRGERIGGIFGFARTLRYILRTYPEHIPVVVWDSFSQRRDMILNGEYKAHRRHRDQVEETEDSKYIYNNICWSKSFAKSLGLHTILLKGYESDDVIAHLTRNNPNGTVIISSDKDFYQLLHFDGVTIDRQGQDEILTKANFASLKGLTPLQYRVYHIISGDAGDAVPGIDGVGNKTIMDLLADLDDQALMPFDLDALVFHASRSSVGRVRRIADCAEDLERNFYLVDLLEVQLLDRCAKDSLRLQLDQSPRLDYKSVIKMFKDFEFVSLAGGFEDHILRLVAEMPSYLNWAHV